MTPYAELAAASNFSFLRGASHPDEMVLQAKALGLEAIGLADRNSFAGVVRAHAAAKEAGIRFVPGVRLLTREGLEAIAYPQDRAAYGRLCRLLTLGNRRAPKGQCWFSLEELLAHAEGQLLVLLAPRPSPPVGEGGGRSPPGEGCGRWLSSNRQHPSSGFDVGCASSQPPSPTRGEGPCSADPRPSPPVGEGGGRSPPGEGCGRQLSSNRQHPSSGFDVGCASSQPPSPTRGEGPCSADPRPSPPVGEGGGRSPPGEGCGRQLSSNRQHPSSGFDVGCASSQPPSPTRGEGLVPQESLLRRVVDGAPDRSALFLALSRSFGPEDQARLYQLAQLAQELGVKPLAVQDALYHHPDRRPLADVLHCIRTHVTIDQAGLALEANAERHLKPPAEMARLFKGHEQAIANQAEILARARFSLDELKYEYPDEVVSPGETPMQSLMRLTWEGAAERFPEGLPEKVRQTIAHEFALIAELDYAKYFLTVRELVRFARERGILCQGRGSAANSTVCFCLGITSVNPAEIDLLFERFVSAERKEPPDIDVDFEHERREEVIQHIYDTYGRDRAGIAATVITYRGKSAIREVGKALGLSGDTVEALAKTLWGWSAKGVDKGHVAGELGLDPEAPRLKLALELSAQLIGFPRHLSQHVGGFVITRGPLEELVPIGNAAMADRTFIEWDKDDLDALGLLKIDVLALGMLTAIAKSFEMLREAYGVDLDLARLPREDPAVYDMICEADTVGVFQIESRAQMSMLPRLKPRCFYDLVIEVAIVRPGPIQGDMVHPYLRRREGLEKVSFPSKALEEVLGKTLGVPLFQEQAMRIAIVAAGFTPAEADQLRRAMATFRKVGIIHQFGLRLIEGMVERGYDRAFAERCFKQIEGFGEYGFPESHAASFAHLVYVSAWIKKHWPEVFCAALLNAQPMGFYAPAQLVRDAKAHGVEVRAPDVNYSDWDCALEGPSPLVGEGGEAEPSRVRGAGAGFGGRGNTPHPAAARPPSPTRGEGPGASPSPPVGEGGGRSPPGEGCARQLSSNRQHPSSGLLPQWERDSGLVQRLPDGLKDAFALSEQVAVPDSQNAEAGLLKMSRSLEVVSSLAGLEMLHAIELKHEPGGKADEICNVGADGNLPPEFEFGETPVPQQHPQQAFGLGQVSAQAARDRQGSIKFGQFCHRLHHISPSPPVGEGGEAEPSRVRGAGAGFGGRGNTPHPAAARPPSPTRGEGPCASPSPPVGEGGEAEPSRVRGVGAAFEVEATPLIRPCGPPSPTGGEGQGRPLRLGLRLIKGFSEADAAKLMAAREAGGPFTSLEDVRRRARLSPAALEKLAHADAFRSIGLDRRRALWEAHALKHEDAPLFQSLSDFGPEVDPALPEMPLAEHVVHDYARLQLSLKAHPLQFFRSRLAARGAVRAADLEHAPSGRRLELAGLVLVRQRPGSARGVIFITLEDETGAANLIVWPKLFERFRPVVLAARLLLARGRLQKEGKVIHLVADELVDMSHQLAELTQGEVALTQEGLARADEVRGGIGAESRAIGQERRDARNARAAKILPKSRDFH